MSSEIPLRIGFDAKRLFTNRTGLGNYSRTLLANLGDYFPDTTYVLYSPSMPDEQIAKQFTQAPYEVVLPGKGRSKSWWRRFGISRRLKADRIQVYHGLSNELPSGIREQGIPAVVTVHDLIFKIYPQTYTWWDRQIYDRKFKVACQQADRIIAISQSTKKDIVNYYRIDPGRIEVMYQACDPLFYREPLEEVEAMTVLESYGIPDRYFLYVGSIIPRKNLLTLVKAIEQLPINDRLPLVVVGRGGSYKKQVAQYVAENGLIDWIIWQDQVLSTHDLKAIYEQASAFIYPSLYEGFGIPVIEALLSNTPVITSKTSSLPEAGGAYAHLIDPLDTEVLAATLAGIIADPSGSASRVKLGHSYASEQFSPEKTSASVMQLYQELLNH